MQSLLSRAQLEISHPRCRKSRCDGMISAANQQKIGEPSLSGQGPATAIRLSSFCPDTIAPRGTQTRGRAFDCWTYLETTPKNLQECKAAARIFLQENTMTGPESAILSTLMSNSSRLSREAGLPLDCQTAPFHRPTSGEDACGHLPRPEGRLFRSSGQAPGVLMPIETRNRLMLRAAWRRRCSFSTIAMRTKPSPSSP